MPTQKKSVISVEPLPSDPQALAALAVASVPVEAYTELANALIQAINATKPPEKKNPFNRRRDTPWTLKNGKVKAKLRRKMSQHGINIDEDKSSDEEIRLLNQVRPGTFLGGSVQVRRRKDRGVDIDYPIKTASQRLRLVNQFGIRSLAELCQALIHEAENPVIETFEEE